MQLGLKAHLTTIARHWGKLLLVMIGAVMVTGAIAFLSSKVYISEARILILNSSPAEQASRPAFDQSGALSSPQEQVLTQVEIIKSPAVAEQLARQLGPQRVLDEMTWRWDWLRALPSTLKDRAVLALYDWDPTARILTQVGIQRPGTGGGGGEPIGAARDKIMDAMHAEGIVKTDMFGVAFAAPSPDFASEALAGLIDIYVEHVVALRRPADAAAIAQDEADRLAARLKEAEEALRTFASDNAILSIGRQKDLALDRRSRLQEDLAGAQRAALETDQRLNALARKAATLPRSEAISVTTRPNPVVDRLRERIVQLQADRQRFVAGSAAARQIEREIASLSSQIDVQALETVDDETTGTSSLYLQLQNTATIEGAELEALSVRSEFLQKELAELEEELRRLDGHELRYRQLERAVEAREEAFRYALQKREETAIQAQIAEPSLAQVVPVEPASFSDIPVSPRRSRLLALGVIAGLLAGIGLTYLLELSRRTIATPQEAELAIGLPVLAATERYGLLTRRLRRTRHEMRRLTMWLQHRREAKGPGQFSFLLSSVHRQSGLSALASELGKALGQQGVPVLVLRLELAKSASDPNLPPLPGGGTDVDPASRAATPGDDVEDAQMQSVTLRAPSWEMVRRVRRILQDREAADEVVLIDAPDLARFPEQTALAALADVVLPVIEADHTRLSDITEQLKDLRAADADVPGVVLTKRRRRNSSWAFSWMAMTQRKALERASL